MIEGFSDDSTTEDVMSAADRSAPAVDADARTDRSLGQLVATATAEMSALVHDEIALAKSELRRDFKRGAAGGSAMGVAGVFALFSLPVLSFAAAYGIHNLGLGLAWSFLIVGGAYLVVAGILSLLALRAFKRVSPPERSIQSTKKTMATLKNVKPHPAVERAEIRAEIQA